MEEKQYYLQPEQIDPENHIAQEELIKQRELLEDMLPEEILDLFLHNAGRAAKIVEFMDLAADVLEGVYGVTIEDMLDERHKQNDKP